MRLIFTDTETGGLDPISTDLLTVPATAKPTEPRLPENTDAWLKRALKNMDRMSMDETFRQEIAKNLS